jgi:spore coat protein U-like protein
VNRASSNRRWLRQRYPLAALMCAALFPHDALAINCQVRLNPIDFGIYRPLQAAPLDVMGAITIRCSAQPGSYGVTIGPGGSGDFAARTLASSAGGTLIYNLYRDPARTQIWGDGSPPTFIVAGARTSQGRPTVTDHPVYGRVFSGQTPDPGTYVDNLLVTVLF